MADLNPPNPMMLDIEKQLQTVYDPEFPVIDIFTLGLIYDISIDDKNQVIHILMTFTTPACPMGDMIEQMVKNAIQEIYPAWEVTIEITFDPMRTPKMIKDEDLQRMFD
jgi:metal-sulfur cluster biosynthetic enzyme